MSCYKCVKEKYCPYIHYFNLNKNVGCIEFRDKDNTTHISNTLSEEYDLGTIEYKCSDKLYLSNDIKSIVYKDKEYDIKILKAFEIIKETPEFAWYTTIYKDAYEMVSDVKGFRVNNSVEELQEMFNLLKEVLS